MLFRSDGIKFINTKKNVLLCIGVKPKEASTAYGYIKVKSREKGNVYLIDKFTEKPKEKIARKFIKSENYLWNAGIFIFRVESILDAIKKYAPLLHAQLMIIKKNERKKRLAYSRMKNTSIDYQVMEKANNLYCVKGNFSWCDLGNWKSIVKLFKEDKEGNVRFGKIDLIDTHNSVIYNIGKDTIGVIGLDDIVVVHTDNGTLVCSKKDAEKVKELTSKI